eukprot:g40145.t1
MLCYDAMLLCYAIMLCSAMLCYAMLCYAMLCHAMPCYAMLCHAMLRSAMLCYAMLCYAMLCYELSKKLQSTIKLRLQQLAGLDAQLQQVQREKELRKHQYIDYESGAIVSVNGTVRFVGNGADGAEDPAVLQEDFVFLSRLFILLFAATLGGIGMTTVGLPTFVGFILAGLVIGPNGLGWIEELQYIEILSQIGGPLLLFNQGLGYGNANFAGVLSKVQRSYLPTSTRYGAHPHAHASPRDSHTHLAPLGGPALPLHCPRVCESALYHALAVLTSVNNSVLGNAGLLWFLLLTIVVLALGLNALGFAQQSAVHLLLAASCFSVASSTVAGQIQPTSRHPRTYTFQVLVKPYIFVEEVLLGVLLCLPNALSRGVWGIFIVAREVAFLCVFVYLTLYLAAKVLPRVVPYIVKKDIPELYVLAMLGLCLGSASITYEIGIGPEIGALTSGLMLTQTLDVRQALSMVEPLTHVFAAIMYSSIGLLMNPVFVLHHAMDIMQLLALVVLSKAVLWWAFLVVRGNSRRDSLLASLCLSQVAEFAILVMGQGLRVGVSTRIDYLLFLTTTVLSLILAPLHLKLGLWVLQPPWQEVDKSHDNDKARTPESTAHKGRTLLTSLEQPQSDHLLLDRPARTAHHSPPARQQAHAQLQVSRDMQDSHIVHARHVAHASAHVHAPRTPPRATHARQLSRDQESPNVHARPYAQHSPARAQSQLSRDQESHIVHARHAHSSRELAGSEPVEA